MDHEEAQLYIPRSWLVSGCLLGALTLSVGAPVLVPPASAKAKASSSIVKLNVKGMHCEGCASAVAKALRSVKGVQQVSVSLKGSSATVKADSSVKPQELAEAVNKTRKFSASVAK